MQISFPNIKNTFNISKVSSKRTSFRGINNNLPTDTFTRSSSELRTVGLCGRTVSGKFVKDVMFDDRKGNKVPGFIIENTEKKNEYFACVNGNAECRMIIEDDKENDCIYLAELYGQNNHGSVKGAGTELVKFAVEKSIEKGHKGKVQLKMGGSFPFHYKNNFRAERYTDSTEMNAAFDYAIRTGCSFSHVWPEWNLNRIVNLSEEGAEMLLKNERMTDKSKSQILYSFEMKTPKGKIKEFDMDFCDLGDKFALQLIDKKASIMAQSAVLTGKINDRELVPEKYKDEWSSIAKPVAKDGNLIPEKYNDGWSDGEFASIQNELEKALKIAQQKLSE